MTDEQKTKISVAKMGHVESDATRAKISAAGMGNTHHLGSHHSEETKAKISAANTERVRSPETRAKLSMAQMGSLNHIWKGGITPVNRLIRTSTKYATWRTAVFERDNYTCQECGGHGGRLEAHHVHEFAEYPEERFIVDNGKTLCLLCHKKTRCRKVNIVAVTL